MALPIKALEKAREFADFLRTENLVYVFIIAEPYGFETSTSTNITGLNAERLVEHIDQQMADNGEPTVEVGLN